MMETHPTVFVVDSDSQARERLRDLLQMMNLPCEIFSSGRDFLNAYDPSRPGCVVLEVRTPGVNGLDVQRHLRTIGATLPVIFLTARATISIAVQAMRSGATHFLEKPFREHELWETIQEAIRLDDQRRRLRIRQEQFDTRIARLTPRQHELMQMIADGKTSKQVASELGVCVRTIENHRAQLMERLEVDSLVELLHYALHARNGYAHLPIAQAPGPQASGTPLMSP